MKSVWKLQNETPRPGSKIEYAITPKIVEVDIWENGQLKFNPEDWPKVKMWRYIDEFYMDKVKEQDK